MSLTFKCVKCSGRGTDTADSSRWRRRTTTTTSRRRKRSSGSGGDGRG